MHEFAFSFSLITMGRKRNTKLRFSPGGRVNSTTSKSCAGGSKERRFSVFEFDDDDMRVEIADRKFWEKFKTISPNKKPSQNRQSVDKYDFLQCFTQGPMTQGNDSGKHMSVVDITDSVSEDETGGTDAVMLPSSSNYDDKLCDSSFLNNQGLGCSYCIAKCNAQGSRHQRGCTTGMKNINVLCVDSDEDESVELRPSTSSFDLAECEGSSEQSSDYGTKNYGCEAVVVVSPCYAKYGNKYYTRCALAFFERCIRLEGSPLSERRGPFCAEWLSSNILNIEHQQFESVKASVVNLHFVSTDKCTVETWDGSSGNVELEFVILDDPQWFKKQEDIKSLDVKYKAAWTTITTECSFDKSFEGIVYPDGDPDAVLISTRDIEFLRPRAFINDTIIDFYIKFLLSKTKPEDQHRFHFFNTFFFQKLIDMDTNLSRGCDGRVAFQHVHKWTRSVDLFEKDYIFIPVNFSLHWSLIVICHPGEVGNLRDNQTDGSSKKSCILHMDSIRGSHTGLENLIRRYLLEEWKVRQHKQDEDISAKFLTLDFVALELPQQENFCDCGLFLLHYTELFLEQVPKFSTTNYFDTLTEDWFHPAEVSLKKRDHIKKLIHKIAKDNALKNSPAPCKYPINEGDNSSQSVKEVSVEESCHVIKIDSSDDLKITRQESFDHKLVQENKHLMPINQSSNMSLPVEEAREKHAIFQHISDDNEQRMASRDSPVSSSTSGETQVTAKISSEESPMMIDLQNEDECVSERYDNSCILIEDLSTCVVEDSEEECEIGTITKRKRQQVAHIIT